MFPIEAKALRAVLRENQAATQGRQYPARQIEMRRIVVRHQDREGNACVPWRDRRAFSLAIGARRFGKEHLDAEDAARAGRSEERRVGNECVSTCRSRWEPYIKKKTKII